MLQKRNNAPLSLNFIRIYWEQMLEAVQAIHDANIIHSDLKPSNFLLVQGSLKLIDFGIAKSIPNDTTNIQRDYQTGTVNYMSPESLMFVEDNGKKQDFFKQGRASDVWSLGCILYRLVYGHPPFGNVPMHLKMHYITSEKAEIDYTKPRALLTLHLKHAIQVCLVRDPKKRAKIPQLLAHAFLNPGTLK
jgi:serine/threonine-protein kinase TTK/MPS1